MGKLLFLSLCMVLLSGCFRAQSDVGRVGQMYFTMIYFTTSGQDIDKPSYKRIEQTAKVFKKDPTVQVEVRGYTDSTGSERGNLNLSLQRAEKVSQALQAQGIPANRISAKGYGHVKPIASNQTPEGRQKNRRVEIEFPYPTH